MVLFKVKKNIKKKRVYQKEKKSKGKGMGFFVTTHEKILVTSILLPQND